MARRSRRSRRQGVRWPSFAKVSVDEILQLRSAQQGRTGGGPALGLGCGVKFSDEFWQKLRLRRAGQTQILKNSSTKYISPSSTHGKDLDAPPLLFCSLWALRLLKDRGTRR
jgi:hypothetical protein